MEVTRATWHNFHLSASMFVFAGDDSPTHPCHVTELNVWVKG